MRKIDELHTDDPTRRHPGHKVYPYLLRAMAIERPNQVWTVDITCIPMNRGFMYLVAVMGWYSWITMAGFVVKINFLRRDCNFIPI